MTDYQVRPPAHIPSAQRELVAAARPAAILVAHGMGQQIPFQTLDDLAEGLRREDRRRRAGAQPMPVARTVTVADQRLQRLELTIALPDGRERDVHIYEAYWAPITEGQVSLRDVTGFLLRSGIGGVAWGVRPFRRWLFGRHERFPAPIRTVLYLVVALAVVVSLAFVNGLMAALAVTRLSLREPPRWLSDKLFADLTTVLNVLVLVLLSFAASIGLARLLRLRAGARKVAGVLSVAALASAIWATIASAAIATALLASHAVAGEEPSIFDSLRGATTAIDRVADELLLWLTIAAGTIGIGWWGFKLAREFLESLRRSRRSRNLTLAAGLAFVVLFGSVAGVAVRLMPPGSFAGDLAGRWRHGLSWPLLVLISGVVRRFLIQYAGDVAAYVQPQLLDRFYDIRQRIKDTVWRAAHAVYSAPEYEDVILVGHSLGSVVVYDVLNRLLLDRALEVAGAPEIVSRTRLLLTFGSPLDKTAFIFGAQGTGSEAREALAASVQPLISDDAVRPPWINIYSPWDVISGALDYYDLPDRTNNRAVVNEIDPDATTLLGAHVEYWTNRRLFEIIIASLG